MKEEEFLLLGKLKTECCNIASDRTAEHDYITHVETVQKNEILQQQDDFPKSTSSQRQQLIYLQLSLFKVCSNTGIPFDYANTRFLKILKH